MNGGGEPHDNEEEPPGYGTEEKKPAEEPVRPAFAVQTHTGRHTGRCAVGTGRRDRNHADHGRGQRAAAAGSARRGGPVG